MAPDAQAMKVAVVGTGHVGLVTAAALASIGHRVTGIDSDREKIELLQNGSAPFFEPGLEDLIRSGIDAGRLSFAAGAAGVAGAEVVFICVGTPARATGEANLAAVEKAAREVALAATGPAVVVGKSTVPAGTAERLRRTLARERPDLRLEVASNPEFLREGRAVADSLEPDRILVGADSDWAFEVMRALYAPLTAKGHRLVETDIATAELAKHACNAFLATKISFANALAQICELAGADVVAVTDVMGADPRIGKEFLRAGLGYGGYCFPKDLQAFEKLAARLGYDFSLLKEVARINEDAVDLVVKKVEESIWNLEDKTVALFGLSFKPGTDDVRLAPALAVARRLLDAGARVVGYDPEASANAKSEVPEIEIAPDAYEAAAGAHCIVVCTEWDEFRALDLQRLKESMSYPVVVDGRNLYDPATMRDLGFTYLAVGRPAIR